MSSRHRFDLPTPPFPDALGSIQCSLPEGVSALLTMSARIFFVSVTVLAIAALAFLLATA